MRAVQLSREELLDRQRSLNAPDSLLITSLFVIPPTIPSGDGSNRFTMVAVGLVLGLALGRGGSVSRMSAAPGGDAQPAWRSNHGGSSRLRSRRSHRWRHRRRTTRTRRRAGVDQPAVRPAAADRPPSTVGDKDEGAGQADETASKTGSPPTPDPIPVVGPQLPSTPATTATPGAGHRGQAGPRWPVVVLPGGQWPVAGHGIDHGCGGGRPGTPQTRTHDSRPGKRKARRYHVRGGGKGSLATRERVLVVISLGMQMPSPEAGPPSQSGRCCAAWPSLSDGRSTACRTPM